MSATGGGKRGGERSKASSKASSKSKRKGRRPPLVLERVLGMTPLHNSAFAVNPATGDIAFPAGASLGISVDEALKVRRVNDPDSRAIKAARYGVVHWTVVEVDGAAVASKSDLVKALQAKTSGDVRVTFESPENKAPQASPLALKRTLDAIGGDEPGEAAGRATASSDDLSKLAHVLRGAQALGRVGKPDDIAQAALWLASDDSSWVTGTAQVVDGGASAGRPWRRQGDWITRKREIRLYHPDQA